MGLIASCVVLVLLCSLVFDGFDLLLCCFGFDLMRVLCFRDVRFG